MRKRKEENRVYIGHGVKMIYSHSPPVIGSALKKKISKNLSCSWSRQNFTMSDTAHFSKLKIVLYFGGKFS